ncbi:PIN domain-containing protein [Pseudomonas bubulae]|uniref:PIN domain-containing protein n=1 Tax=Pseudomonas bubulae TaxID=2316085 RepID=UPI00399FA3D7
MKDPISIDQEYSENLRQKLICGEITAITFDTQIFDRNGRTFRGGLIGQLEQLKSSNIQLIITELVRDEAEKHMLAMHRAKNIKIEEAASTLRSHLSQELFDEVQEELSDRMTPENIVFHEINDFFLATDAELITYEYTSTRKLLESYFKNAPPFHKQNSKKSEFPDAAALLCLEEFASKNGVLVVSEDNDWITFCRESKLENLHCVPDLSVALTLINSVKHEIKEIVEKRLKAFKEFSDSGQLQSVIKHNAAQKLKENLKFTGRTGLLYSSHCTGVDVISTSFSDDKTFGIIREDSSLTVWALELDLKCHIKADVSFTSADDTYLGNSQYEGKLITSSTSIIKITGTSIDIETMINKNQTLDLGEIVPNENRHLGYSW